jgi:hypothetical protein
MEKFELALKALSLAAAAAKSAVAARELYEKFVEQAERTNEFTPEQVADLRARAKVEFASEASQPSGR